MAFSCMRQSSAANTKFGHPLPPMIFSIVLPSIAATIHGKLVSALFLHSNIAPTLSKENYHVKQSTSSASVSHIQRFNQSHAVTYCSHDVLWQALPPRCSAHKIHFDP